MDDSGLAARQLVGQRGLYRSLGERTPGSAVVERPGGVLAAIVPARPDRSVFNSVVYEDPDALLAVRDELDAAYAAAGVQAWTVWVRPEHDALRAALEDAGHAFDGQPMLMAAAIDELDLGGPRPPQRPRLRDRSGRLVRGRLRRLRRPAGAPVPRARRGRAGGRRRHADRRRHVRDRLRRDRAGGARARPLVGADAHGAARRPRHGLRRDHARGHRDGRARLRAPRLSSARAPGDVRAAQAGHGFVTAAAPAS